jgi:hypothetical protein
MMKKLICLLFPAILSVGFNAQTSVYVETGFNETGAPPPPGEGGGGSTPGAPAANIDDILYMTGLLAAGVGIVYIHRKKYIKNQLRNSE